MLYPLSYRRVGLRVKVTGSSGSLAAPTAHTVRSMPPHSLNKPRIGGTTSVTSTSLRLALSIKELY